MTRFFSKWATKGDERKQTNRNEENQKKRVRLLADYAFSARIKTTFAIRSRALNFCSQNLTFIMLLLFSSWWFFFRSLLVFFVSRSRKIHSRSRVHMITRLTNFVSFFISVEVVWRRVERWRCVWPVCGFTLAKMLANRWIEKCTREISVLLFLFSSQTKRSIEKRKKMRFPKWRTVAECEMQESHSSDHWCRWPLTLLLSWKWKKNFHSDFI